MFGLLGDQVIGLTGHLGPVEDGETLSMRLVRHELQRGKPILQDLGNDAGSRSLKFFFDETFCDPQAELAKLHSAFKGRKSLRLYFDQAGFKLSAYTIEKMTITRQKTTPRGRLVRVEIELEMVESATDLSLSNLFGTLASAVLNPFLRRG